MLSAPAGRGNRAGRSTYSLVGAIRGHALNIETALDRPSRGGPAGNVGMQALNDYFQLSDANSCVLRPISEMLAKPVASGLWPDPADSRPESSGTAPTL